MIEWPDRQFKATHKTHTQAHTHIYVLTITLVTRPDRLSLNLIPGLIATLQLIVAWLNKVPCLHLKELAYPAPHLHPHGVIEMEHVGALLLTPVTEPVMGQVLPRPAAVLVHHVLTPSPQSKDCEVRGFEPALLVQPFYLMVQVHHVREAIPEIWGRFTFRREPAELRGIVQGTNGAGVVQLRVELMGLVHDILDEVVVLSQYGVRLVPPNEVIQASKQQHVHGPSILKQFNFPSISQITDFPPGDSNIVDMRLITLIYGGGVVLGGPELVQHGGGEADLSSGSLNRRVRGFAAWAEIVTR